MNWRRLVWSMGAPFWNPLGQLTARVPYVGVPAMQRVEAVVASVASGAAASVALVAACGNPQ
jgi:hypothetical protein